MKILLVSSSIVVPVVMLYLQHKNDKFKMIFNIAAVISTIIFGSIASTKIYQIIVDDAVFMTTIHAIFLNPVFLVTGAYLGVFIIFRLMILTLEDR
ncbi:transposase [Lysinibacillus sp. NPDC092081]|uniref:transposase n=1 Tax=Lysinibacillus sp. NPDC092081 TaxID=3364131 RepID=UPI00380A5560